MSTSANPLIRKMSQLFPLTQEEEAALLDTTSRIASFGRGEDIVSDGDRPSDSNLLLEGWVHRYKILSEGKRQILAFQFPGDIFDAQSFILEKMDHSIATMTACRVAVIPHKKLLAVTERYPRIARAIWKDTLVDAAIFREWVTNVGRRDAVQRIAHLICEITARLRIVGLADRDRIDWPMTQAELADATGLSTVHVNRSLQKLRSNGFIELKGVNLTILRWQELADFAEFEPGYLHATPARKAA